MPRSLKNLLLYSVIGHVVTSAFMFYATDLFGLLPKKKTKTTWVAIAKGTGEVPSNYSFIQSKGLPASTLREQEKALKEKAKDKTGTDQKSLESVNKKPPVQEYTENQKTSPEGGINLKSKEGTEERTIEEALAKVQADLDSREAPMEAGEVKKEGLGQAPEGTLNATNTETNPILIAYYAALKRKINEQWITTPKSAEGADTLKTQVNVMIDAQGQIRETAYKTKSGDVAFDLSAMRAVERAAPFPPPPTEILDEAVSEGFLIEFNPRSAGRNDHLTGGGKVTAHATQF